MLERPRCGLTLYAAIATGFPLTLIIYLLETEFLIDLICLVTNSIESLNAWHTPVLKKEAILKQTVNVRRQMSETSACAYINKQGP